MKVGAGKHTHQLFGDLLGAAELGEVIVNHSNLHAIFLTMQRRIA